jgi:hypothetical protein
MAFAPKEPQEQQNQNSHQQHQRYNAPSMLPAQPLETVVQPQLEVGQPGDKYEQEADAMADKVMRSTDESQVQMMASEEEESVQMMPEMESNSSVQMMADVPSPEIMMMSEPVAADSIQMMEEEEESPVQMKIQRSVSSDSGDEEEDEKKKGDLAGVRLKQEESPIQTKIEHSNVSNDDAPEVQLMPDNGMIQKQDYPKRTIDIRLDYEWATYSLYKSDGSFIQKITNEGNSRFRLKKPFEGSYVVKFHNSLGQLIKEQSITSKGNEIVSFKIITPLVHQPISVPKPKDIVTTWGTFKVPVYEDTPNGLNVQIEFHPNDKTNARAIGLVQVVKNKIAGKNVVDHPTAENQTSAEGYRIDATSTNRNPLYGTLSSSGRTTPDATLESTPNSSRGMRGAVKNIYELGQSKQYNWVGDKKKHLKALLKDTPHGTTSDSFSGQYFETTALAIRGPHQGKYYGSITWGWETHNKKKYILPVKLKSEGNPSSDFMDAAEKWNDSKTQGEFQVKNNNVDVRDMDYEIIKDNKRLSKPTKVELVKPTPIRLFSDNIILMRVKVLSGNYQGQVVHLNVNDLKDVGGGDSKKTMNLPIRRKPEIQRKENGASHASPELTNQINSTKGKGQSLSDSTKKELGGKMGADFSNVKVHTDDEAAQMNKDLGAKAFTHGNDVYFNEGNYNPSSSEGKHLLAHELTHTVQQGGAPASIQRSEIDNSVGGDKLKDSESKVNKYVNEKLEEGRKKYSITKESKEDAVIKFIDWLYQELGYATALKNKYRSGIEVWADNLGDEYVYHAEKKETKYKDAGGGVWALRSLSDVIGGNIKVAGEVIGTDKLGHFFSEGHLYFSEASAALKEVGWERFTLDSFNRSVLEEKFLDGNKQLEEGKQGGANTGVFSYADQAANYSGFTFYKTLLKNPMLTFSVRTFMAEPGAEEGQIRNTKDDTGKSSSWNEDRNPNAYVSNIADGVWKNILTRKDWNGTGPSGNVSLKLSKGKKDKLTGKLVFKGGSETKEVSLQHVQLDLVMTKMLGEFDFDKQTFDNSKSLDYVKEIKLFINYKDPSSGTEKTKKLFSEGENVLYGLDDSGKQRDWKLEQASS